LSFSDCVLVTLNVNDNDDDEAALKLYGIY